MPNSSPAIVTGASRGFGRAIAAALTAAGTTVVGVARDESALELAGKELGERFIAWYERLITQPIPQSAPQPAPHW